MVANAKINPAPRQVLFVDDDPDMLALLAQSFAALSAGRWAIHCVSTPAAALVRLKQQPMDLVVLDVNMPLLDGIQFLRLLGKRYPNLKKVTLTAYATEEKRSACLGAGAELFIEKPQSADGFKAVFAMLDDLMNWAPQQGFQGMLRRVGLPDVIQMECLGRNSSVLEVHNENLRGRIFIENGNIRHAAAGGLTGERALQRLLALAGGSFELLPFEPPPEHSISGSWEFLLMEAARVRDEIAAQAPGETPGESAPAPLPPARIKEILLCTGKGEPLYDWQCPDVAARVSLLQQISQQAIQLHQLLPLGKFDRLEIRLADGRALAQTRADRMVYVHSRTLGPTP